jgi:hypothetical protein
MKVVSRNTVQRESKEGATMLNFAHGYQEVIAPLYQHLALLSRWIHFHWNENPEEMEPSVDPKSHLASRQQLAALGQIDANTAFVLAVVRMRMTELMK